MKRRTLILSLPGAGLALSGCSLPGPLAQPFGVSSLRAFCATSSAARPLLERIMPMAGGHAVATDGRCLVRMLDSAALADEPDPDLLPGFEQMRDHGFEAAFRKVSEPAYWSGDTIPIRRLLERFGDLPPRESLREWQVCETCAASGGISASRDWRWNRHGDFERSWECADCDGEGGWEEVDILTVPLWRDFANYEYLSLLATRLPGVEFYASRLSAGDPNPEHPGTPLTFRWDHGDGLLMPMRYPEAPARQMMTPLCAAYAMRKMGIEERAIRIYQKGGAA